MFALPPFCMGARRAADKVGVMGEYGGRTGLADREDVEGGEMDGWVGAADDGDVDTVNPGILSLMIGGIVQSSALLPTDMMATDN